MRDLILNAVLFFSLALLFAWLWYRLPRADRVVAWELALGAMVAALLCLLLKGISN